MRSDMIVHRLVYRSDVAISVGDDASGGLAQILDRARAANQRADLTGALMVASNTFVQALEGPLPALEQTFERICRDFRHRRVRLLEFVEAEDRVFGEWPLGFVRPGAEIAGLCSPLDAGAMRLGPDASTSGLAQMMRALLVTNAQTFDAAAAPEAPRLRQKPATKGAAS
nr:BLUF domain-containing protein [Chenggangzhangella methanolivorans]